MKAFHRIQVIVQFLGKEKYKQSAVRVKDMFHAKDKVTEKHHLAYISICITFKAKYKKA